MGFRFSKVTKRLASQGGFKFQILEFKPSILVLAKLARIMEDSSFLFIAKGLEAIRLLPLSPPVPWPTT